MVVNPLRLDTAKPGAIDWRSILHHVAISRALDDLEESTLLRERKVLYQFSARGHDLTQVLLSTQLNGRSRRCRRLLPIATAAAGVGTAAGRGARIDHDARRRHERRPRHRRGVQHAAQERVRACCRCAAAWVRNTRRQSVGRSRCAIASSSWASKPAGTASPSRMAARHRPRPMDSGLPSTSSPPNSCPSYFSSRTTATEFPCLRSSKLPAATSPAIWKAFAGCEFSTAMARIRWPPPR